MPRPVNGDVRGSGWMRGWDHDLGGDHAMDTRTGCTRSGVSARVGTALCDQRAITLRPHESQLAAHDVPRRAHPNRSWRRAAAALALGSVLCAGSTMAQATSETAMSPQSLTSIQVVASYIAAFNKRDVAAMIEMAHPSVVWLSIVGDSVRAESRGTHELARQLTSYFSSYPTAKSESVSVIANGAWVAVHERATWDDAGVPNAQSGLAIYEIRAKRVARVWYYPVVRE
jgi:hypothetical protein